METLVIEPESPFSEIPRSDTLFGAICWGIRLSRGEEALENLLARFAERDPPFLVSSAFPRLERDDPDADPAYLLPKPLLPDIRSGTETAGEARIEALGTWKQIEYVPSGLFAALVSGELSSDGLLGGLEAGMIVLDGQRYERLGRFVLPVGDGEAGSLQRPYQRAEQTRNAINRLTGSTDGNLYHRERVFFAANAGLHVLVDGEADIVAESLAVLQDRGIGGGRSVGNGQFRLGGFEEIEGIEGVESPSADAKRSCTLSLCIPRPDEMEPFFGEGYYEVVTRQGVVENSMASPDGIWKRRVLALAEGSVLPWRGSPQGHNPIVADHFAHGVQQFGYALGVGVERELP